MIDSIEYEIVNWKPREVWHCAACKRYRHRDFQKGLLPAICCEQPAKLIDIYEQPSPVVISEPVSEFMLESWPPEPWPVLRDEGLELIMAQMQAAALLFPESTKESDQGAEKL